MIVSGRLPLLNISAPLCVWLAACSAWGGTLVELRDQVTLSPQPFIQLKDVAQVTGTDAAIASQLELITLSPAPTAGRNVRVTFEEVRSRMQALGVNLTEVEFRGRLACEVRVVNPATPAVPVRTIAAKEPPAVRSVVSQTTSRTPTRRETELATEQVLLAFRRAFRTADGETQGWDIRCELDPAVAAELAQVAAGQLHFREAAVTPGVAQPMTVWWQADDGAAHSVRVTITVTATPLVLVLKQSLPAGAIIRPDDLEWTPGGDKSTQSLRVADVIAKQTQRNLRAGHPLSAEDLTAIPLVRSNDIVTVWVRYGGVTVRRPFKALGTGALGETITLMALDDPRVRIQAEVTGYHEASLTADPAEPRNVYRDGRGDVRLAEPSRPLSGGGRP